MRISIPEYDDQATGKRSVTTRVKTATVNETSKSTGPTDLQGHDEKCESLFAESFVQIRTIELHECCAWTGPGSTPHRFGICKPKGVYRRGVDEGPNDTPTIELKSDHRQLKRRLRAMQGPRTIPTARRVIQGIEAVHMLRKSQLLGSQRTNLATISIAFALLLKMA